MEFKEIVRDSSNKEVLSKRKWFRDNESELKAFKKGPARHKELFINSEVRTPREPRSAGFSEEKT